LEPRRTEAFIVNNARCGRGFGVRMFAQSAKAKGGLAFAAPRKKYSVAAARSKLSSPTAAPARLSAGLRSC
jgi:hypothetical protein